MVDNRPTARPLGELVKEHQAGVYKHRSRYGDGHNIIGVGDLFRHDAIDGQVFRRACLTRAEAKYFALEEDDLLYAESSLVLEGIAKTLHVTARGKGTAFAWHTRRVRLNGSLVDGNYLAKFLSSREARRFIMSRATQTVLTGMPVAAYFETPIRLPLLPEQRQIAAILDTVDHAIRKTEQIIAKLKQVKEGLLHDLLTCGIDDNGELRDPDRHPEQFKDSPRGRIPRGWGVSSVGQLLSHIIDYRGRTPKKLGMSWGGTIPALSANNVKMGAIDLREPTYFGSDALYARWMTNGSCEPGDVLLTMEAPLGNVTQIPDQQRYILSQRVVLFRFSGDSMVNDFAATQMRGAAFQAALVKRSTGTTATGIQRAVFVEMPMLVPTVSEQRLIADVVAALERRLQTEICNLQKHRLLKTGLLEDLVTGRVRANKILESEAP